MHYIACFSSITVLYYQTTWIAHTNQVKLTFVLFALLLFSCCFRLELAPEDLFLYDRYAKEGGGGVKFRNHFKKLIVSC